MWKPDSCRAGDRVQIGQRELTRVGGLGLIGVSASDLLRLEARTEAPPVGPASWTRAVESSVWPN
jgi:hypothetical protein